MNQSVFSRVMRRTRRVSVSSSGRHSTSSAVRRQRAATKLRGSVPTSHSGRRKEARYMVD